MSSAVLLPRAVYYLPLTELPPGKHIWVRCFVRSEWAGWRYGMTTESR